MNFLAIETSSDACSVALQIGDQVAEKHIVKPRVHTQVLLPMITELLNDAGATTNDLNAVILGNGPGSFIGMRIGASVAQGLCYAAGIKVVPVSSLAVVAAEAVAKLAEPGVVRIAVTQDARMNEVYLGCFAVGDDGRCVAEVEEQIVKVGRLDLRDARYAAGAAWQKYPELLSSNRESIAGVVDVSVPRASYLLSLGVRQFRSGRAIEAEALIPAYIRMKVAEKPG